MTAALDVAFLADLTDAVALVVRAHSTARPLARSVLQQLQQARSNILGVVLTQTDSPHDSLGSYYYQYRHADYGKVEA